MKIIYKMFLALICYSIILTCSTTLLYSQITGNNTKTNSIKIPYTVYGIPYHCDLVPDLHSNRAYIGGQYKPENIDRYTNSPDAYFPVLILFVQFLHDLGPQVPYWNSGQPPEFLKTMISQQKQTSINWWDDYDENNATLSDFWMEASRGHLHVVGQAISIILPYEYTYYQSTNGGHGMEQINDDIYAVLRKDYSSIIDWPGYDRWKFDETLGTFVYQPDGYVDMIYKVFRSHNPGIGMPAGGIAFLYTSYAQGADYLIYSDGSRNIYIDGNYGYIGSGITMTPGYGYDETDPRYFRNGPMNKLGTISFAGHEHGHYLWGAGHQCYGKMSGAGSDFGVDLFLSPYESMQMGYMKPELVDFMNPGYSINDFTSRYDNSLTTGQVLQVPVNVNLPDNEFFLVANRMQVSSYDKIMWGDTAHGDFNRVVNPDYGKGIYIYHLNPGYPGYPFGKGVDQECADGLFMWSQDGYRHPDWSCDQEVGYNYRDAVSYLNDNGGDYTILTPHDGKSLETWFGIGQPENPLCSGGDGIDKIYTNQTDVWTSREFLGDRWDPWRIGYNEVFSPYSSPSTCSWDNENTGIFIYLQSSFGNYANLKIYKVDQGGFTLDSILKLTPPSRPMGLSIKFSDCDSNGFAYPVLTWNHNMEPDMIRMLPGDHPARRYYVYKAVSTSSDIVPSDYIRISAVDIIPQLKPSFTDMYTKFPCSNTVSNNYVRYEVSAIDNTDWESVKSDFVATSSVAVPQKNILNLTPDVPQKFNLSQNYPNPFNPTTQIKYAVPHDAFVTIKVYNLLGQEVATLVNEIKQTGYYSVTFEGSNMASGVYFYKIVAGDFADVKKMVLVK